MAASLSEHRQFLHLQHRMHGATSRRNGDANSSSIPNPANIPITCSTNTHGVTNRNEIQNKASPNTHTHTQFHRPFSSETWVSQLPPTPPPPIFFLHLFLCCASSQDMPILQSHFWHNPTQSSLDIHSTQFYPTFIILCPMQAPAPGCLELILSISWPDVKGD